MTKNNSSNSNISNAIDPVTDPLSQNAAKCIR